MRFYILSIFSTVVLANCPYSALWLRHGPKKAAEILAKRGYGEHEEHFSGRKLAETAPAIGYGTCVYENPFAGTTDCVQLTGGGFTDASAKTACDNMMGGMAQGVLAKGTRCFASSYDNLAGHCYTVEGATAQAMPMLTSPMMSTCDQVADACKTWSRGNFVFAGKCAEGATGSATAHNHAPTANGAPTAAPRPQPACKIAPGPMGAAHQHAQARGYPSNCDDAPAKNSKYQLPSRWKASHHSISLPFDDNREDTYYTTTGTVYYDFSKNYKRADTFETTGNVPFGFNGPADDWTGRKSSTMLHRGDKMFFINYMKDGTATCTYLDMIVGNIRPDWYMDNRGAATSVQFLGNQHIYPMNSSGARPTLVKQWRKKDFADMYFVMSVANEPDKDGVHWPIQMNVPGEGFGPDGLQSYWNHEQFGEEEVDAIFFVDRDLDCKPHSYGEMEGEGGGGPPDMGEKEIPSKLNVDEAGWFELEYTASPQGPSLARAMFAAQGKSGAKDAKPTRPGFVDLSGQGSLQVCKQSSGKVHVTANFPSASGWGAVGIRPSERCRMVPATAHVTHKLGGDSDWSVHTGDLSNDMRSGSSAGFVANAKVAQGVEVVRADGGLVMSFTTDAPTGDEIHFSFALGKSAEMSYHSSRGCASVGNIPTCSASSDQVAVARKEAPAAEIAPACPGVAAVQKSISDLAEKMSAAHAKPKCGQFKSAAQCKRWSLFCGWRKKKCQAL